MRANVPHYWKHYKRDGNSDGGPNGFIRDAKMCVTASLFRTSLFQDIHSPALLTLKTGRYNAVDPANALLKKHGGRV